MSFEAVIQQKLEAIEFPKWSRLPVTLLVADLGLRRWVPKLIWLVIPLEYYVITRFAGGLSTESYLSAVIFSAICVLSFLVAGFVVALAWPSKAKLQSRSRGAVAALLIVWSTALLLMALSCWLTLMSTGQPTDVLADVVYNAWPSGRSPHKPSLQNFVAQLGYAAVAAVIDAVVIRKFWAARASGNTEPARSEWIYTEPVRHCLHGRGAHDAASRIHDRRFH